MKFSLALIAAVASVVSAAGSADLISQIPSCALKCIQSAESGAGCGSGDYSCSCSKLSQLTPIATECLLKGACEANVVLQLPGLISKICSAVSAEGGSSGSTAAGSSAAASTAAASTTSGAASSAAASTTAAASTEAPATTAAASASNTRLIPLIGQSGTASSGSVGTTGSPAASTTGAAIVDSGAERIGAAGLALAAAVAIAL
ncbi:hypothetical protein Cpir12675_006781 [Ceratocystis pirilliformis]|uniref:CFEM domain-containing protein n=1 Tax=Ceratocystis pirilliformis TaxID=259994 RepID=A0ABR3YGM4_9PEZI